jgi:uncharacterized protein YaiL (DUF2058 family)
MADSLRDQLLKSGIVKQVRDEPRANSFKGAKSVPGKPAQAAGRPGGGRPGQHGKPPHKPKPSSEEIDLAKAYAIRAQTDAAERKRAEQAAAEQARIKRERKAQLQKLLENNTIPQADTEQVRHFEYGNKIRRVHVDDAQLAGLNAGELGVVQQNGRYLLVSRDVAEQVRQIDAQHLALLVEPGSGGVGDDGVPDDLMW